MSKVILALSFGKPLDIDSNRLIAKLARKFSQDGKYPIVADMSVPLSSVLDNVLWIGERAEVHIPTLRLLEEFTNLLLENRWDKIYLVSEPCYLKRCARDLCKILKKRLEYRCKIIRVAHKKGDPIWWDKRSTQWWTRSRSLFLLQEILGKLIPFWLRKFITK